VRARERVSPARMGLQGCCGCTSLKEGSRAIGITYIVLSVLASVYYTWKLIEFSQGEPGPSWSVYTYGTGSGIILIEIIFNGLLVYGVKRSSRGLMLAWLIFNGIITVIRSLVPVGFIVVCAMYGVPLLYLYAAIYAAVMALFWYWFAVVLAHYKELKAGDELEHQQHTMEKK